ncbi:MAG: glycosyltransferase, partial [Pirellulaceae bacterium]
MDVSVVVPVFNEQDNIPLVYQQLIDVLGMTSRSFEIVFVDDGSTDRSRERMRMLAQDDHRVKLVLLRRNYGQTA